MFLYCLFVCFSGFFSVINNMKPPEQTLNNSKIEKKASINITITYVEATKAQQVQTTFQTKSKQINSHPNSQFFQYTDLQSQFQSSYYAYFLRFLETAFTKNSRKAGTLLFRALINIIKAL